MGYEQSLKYISLRANSTALSTAQYKAVKASSSEGYFAAGTTNATNVVTPIVGILQDAPTVAGEACSIAIFNGGVSKAVCGSTALIPGSRAVIGAAGVIASTSDAVARDIIVGPWLSAGGSSGSIGSLQMNILGITT